MAALENAVSHPHAFRHGEIVPRHIVQIIITGVAAGIIVRVGREYGLIVRRRPGSGAGNGDGGSINIIEKCGEGVFHPELIARKGASRPVSVDHGGGIHRKRAVLFGREENRRLILMAGLEGLSHAQRFLGGNIHPHHVIQEVIARIAGGIIIRVRGQRRPVIRAGAGLRGGDGKRGAFNGNMNRGK